MEGFSPHIVTRVNDFHSSALVVKSGTLPGVSRPSGSRVMSMGISHSSMSSVGRMYLKSERVGDGRRRGRKEAMEREGLEEERRGGGGGRCIDRRGGGES